MGLLQYGQGLGAFADSFLKSYMSFEENERANKAQEMKAEMMRQEQEDRQRQEAMRQLQMQHLKQQMELAAAAEQRKAADVQRENAARAALSTPVPNVSSSRGMLTGALQPGQNPWVRPTGEKALNAILPYLDPEKAAGILSQQGNIDDRLAMQMMIANQNNEARRDIATQGNETRKDIATSNNAMREALARLKTGGHTTNVYQQSQFVDSDGTPLLFDKKSGKYLRPDGGQPESTGRRQPAETVVSGATFESLKKTAENIINNPNKYKYVGPLDSLQNKAKAATIGDKDFAKFRADIEQMIETSYALSGKQISEREIKMLEKLRGSLSMPDKTFDGAMEEYLKWLDQKLNLRNDAFQRSGYATGHGSPSTTPKQRFIIKQVR
jgi:hypothetical protein